jgi:hypothetical protein
MPGWPPMSSISTSHFTTWALFDVHPPPHPHPSYWNEYIFEAYAGHDDQAIWLRGLPDVAESRPHVPKCDPRFVFPDEAPRAR